MRSVRTACVAVLLVFASAALPAAQRAARPGPALGPVGAAIEADGRLVLAVRLMNEGAKPIRGVAIDAIDVKPLSLAATKLPLQLGDIAAEGSAILRAAFEGRDAKVHEYRLLVAGRYVQDGRTMEFRAARLFRPIGQPSAQRAKRTFVTPQMVDGAPFTPVGEKPQTFQIEEEEGRAPPLPSGTPSRGSQPAGPSTLLGIATPAGAPAEPHLLPAGLKRQNDPVLFRTHRMIGDASTFIRPPEPTGATSFRTQSPPLDRDVVFAAGNTNAAFSIDGGGTFTAIDPRAIFDFTEGAGNPIDGGGLCCDQVVEYVPSINRYVWLMLTQPRRVANRGIPIGPNRMRVAVASPQDIVESGGTRWNFFDVTPSSLGWPDTRWFDYPDLSFGNTNLYISASIVDPDARSGMTAAGLLVARVKLTDVRDGTVRMPVEFLPPELSSVADHARLVQHAGDTAFWAGHVTDSRVRVFSWPESSPGAAQHDVGIYPWSSADYSALDPEGRNWMPQQHGAIIAGTRRAGEVWFAWTAARDSTFPHPYVEVLRIDAASFAFVGELPIWNPGHVFAYPSLTVNGDQEVGIAAAWGGGGAFYGNAAVGILGDFILWITGVSDASAVVRAQRGLDIVLLPTFGDYLTARTHSPDRFLFSGYTYQVRRDDTNPGACEPSVAGCRFEVMFTLFGRRSRIAP